MMVPLLVFKDDSSGIPTVGCSMTALLMVLNYTQVIVMYYYLGNIQVCAKSDLIEVDMHINA